MDCYPTILEVAGLPPTPDQPLDGVSLVPLLTGQTLPDRDAICFHYPNYAFHKQNRLGGAIRIGQHKLIKRYRDGSLELYDLSDDLSESNNIADQFPELAQRLENRLESWLRETGANMPVHSQPKK